MANKNVQKPQNSKVVTSRLVDNVEAQKTVLALDPNATFTAPETTTPTTAQPETAATKAATPATEKKVKTQGIFQITSKFDPTVSIKGSSSQIEVCTRDYLSWCLKNKAPKTLQAEFDLRHKADAKLEPKDVFTVETLKVCATDKELKAAKAEFGLNPSSSRTTEVKKPTPALLDAQVRACQKFATEFVTSESAENAGVWSEVAVKLEEVAKLLDTLTAKTAPKTE